MRIATVTPYYKETPAILQRCHASVAGQTYPCDHILVADGYPADCVEAWGVRHIRLDAAHADFGCTPRCIGAISAILEGYDAVALLDADNWFAPDHIKACVAALQRSDADIVFSGRRLITPDGRLLDIEEEADISQTSADTSCYVISAKAAFTLPWWGLMNAPLKPACDRFMFQLLKARQLKMVWTQTKSVFFETNYASHFKAAGLPPPASPHDHHLPSPQQYVAAVQSPLTAQRLGFPIRTSWTPPSTQ
jgi:hypothetical protein